MTAEQIAKVMGAYLIDQYDEDGAGWIYNDSNLHRFGIDAQIDLVALAQCVLDLQELEKATQAMEIVQQLIHRGEVDHG